jgi:redox-sensitive bicupin YhaK (pirin superfamily)
VQRCRYTNESLLRNSTAWSTLPEIYDEPAVHVVSGEVGVGERTLASGAMAAVAPGKPVQITARADRHFLVTGAAALGPRHGCWNFVSSSRERIEQSKIDWQKNRFELVPGDPEFIPMPN